MAPHPTKARTRSYWLRSEPTRTLHAIVGKFDLDRTEQDLTGHQEWLYDRIVVELERRHLAERFLLNRCWCRYCVPPFPDTDT